LTKVILTQSVESIPRYFCQPVTIRNSVSQHQTEPECYRQQPNDYLDCSEADNYPQ